MLARAVARTREVATRLALGASRWRVARLFLAEGGLLAVAGGTLGGLLAYGGVQLIRLVNPDANPARFIAVDFPRMSDASVDGRVLGYTLVISLLAALLFSVAPALTGSRPALAAALKDAGRGATAGRRLLRLRGALVVAQVALALVLVTGAGLMVTSMAHLQAVDPGFDTEQLLTFSMRLAAETGEPKAELSPRGDAAGEWNAFVTRVLRRVQALPGVESAAGIYIAPLSHEQTSAEFMIAGRPPPPGCRRTTATRKGTDSCRRR